jgi:TRAP-type C4-dicarboxylate transport system substrate-binding protein
VASDPSAVASAAPSASVNTASLTLRLATPEELNFPSQPFLNRFASAVAEGSNGQMAVEMTYNAGGQAADKEQIVANRVISGDVEIAVVPVRTWGDVGVTSLQALQAPFLIDNDALLGAVTGDDTLLQPLLDGMQEQGLVGLAAWPEDLRHPFTFPSNGTPLVRPDDFEGQTVWAIRSKAQQELLTTLGATAIDQPIIDSLVKDGSLRGAESGLWAGALGLPERPTVTADVTLYPKIQVIVMEDAAWNRLSEDQQAVVRTAAIAARDLAIKDHRTDASLAKAYCAIGGTVVLAGPANVVKFMDAARPVYDRLESDPVTATAIEAIRTLKTATTPSEPTAACKPAISATATIPPVEPGPEIGPIADGTYQQPPMTMDDLLAKGVDATSARNNAGTWSMVVKGSTLTWTLKHPSGQVETCSNSLTNLGDRIRWTPNAECDGPWTEFRWTLDGDQLTLKHVNEATNRLSELVAYDGITGGPWTKTE